MTTLILILILIISIADNLLRKRLVTGMFKSLQETDAEKVYLGLRVIFTVVFIPLIVFVYKTYDYSVIKWVYVVAMITFLSSQSLIERKYLEGKKHIATISLMAIGIIAILSIFGINGY
ncbi:DUF4181 domain-containing protein [Anaerobacillus isosaccharinicus]|uniref:DUF4181 domain-containing protein n=1 Tax=Anaerobacillus isosaccharinicus TaxID=1532552 RepID=A0A1S2MFR1_9BACI|nr:DUF4181 domain-containing protein [Anaerobacillus isosaccharinicus]MBA5587175.1 DUF4181 domain-containing protein [Anaerobacillus isosaccharinicus]QOY34629.1 DUF4181 domain-containing protein [Anaerobacillus isosaccharinicus]